MRAHLMRGFKGWLGAAALGAGWIVYEFGRQALGGVHLSVGHWLVGLAGPVGFTVAGLAVLRWSKRQNLLAQSHQGALGAAPPPLLPPGA